MYASNYPTIVDKTINEFASTVAVVVTSFKTNVIVYCWLVSSKEQVIFVTSSCSKPELANTALIACCEDSSNEVEDFSSFFVVVDFSSLTGSSTFSVSVVSSLAPRL